MRKRFGLLIAAICLALAGGFYAAHSANAGQTNDFGPYARQGIESQLVKIYGKNGIPYTVTCTDVSHFPNQGNLVDTVTCKIKEK